MVRFSDFLGEEHAKRKPEPLRRTPETPRAKDVPPEAPPKAAVPPTWRPTTGVSQTLEVHYAKLIDVVKQLFAQARSRHPLDLTDAAACVAGLPEPRRGECEAILSLVDRHTPENYLYSHSANVSLLAQHLGYCLGHREPSVRSQLALAGLILDIGMAGEGERLAAEPRALTDEERKVITKHPTTATELLKDAQEARDALGTIAAHHERLKGQGYPQGLTETTITEFAKILAVCDVYDAMTHPRSHRKRINPAHVIRMLLDGVDDQFDRAVVKVLVDEISLYPRGSLVSLSTNEIAIVQQIHREAPLRPSALITHDAHRNPLPTPRQMDLRDQPFIYVKEIVEDELPSGDEPAPEESKPAKP